MKEKILTLIIGMLIGAVITSGIFLLINKNNTKSFNRDMRGTQSEMSKGNPGEKGNTTSGENSNAKGGKNKSKGTTENTVENTTESNNTSSQEATTSPDITE